MSESLTEEERKIFQQLLNRPENHRQLQQIIDRELEEHAFAGPADKELAASVKGNIFKRIRTVRKPARTVAINWRRWAVAAAFIPVIGCGLYWWMLTHNEKFPATTYKPEKPVENILAPGENRATLTLADGSKIVLDKARRGALAQQGPVKIIKLRNGELAYTAGRGDTGEVLYNTVTTPKGGQYQLVLADGSKVWLNAASSLRFPASFAGNTRVVELTGEGYFEVAKNPSRPFHVRLNGMDVQVLGTQFNVNGYQDETEMRTTLLEGKVRVTSGHKNRVLRPGEQCSVNEKGNVQVMANVNTDEAVAWKNGLFYFKSADIRTVLRQVSRWYDVDFVYQGKIKAHFSGQISRNVNADELLKILELTGKVHFVVNGRKITVKP